MNITGEIKVRRKDFENGASYSIQISKKDEEGNWKSAYLPVKFVKNKKDFECSDNEKIKLKEAFLSVNNNGKLQLIVMDCERMDLPF